MLFVYYGRAISYMKPGGSHIWNGALSPSVLCKHCGPPLVLQKKLHAPSLKILFHSPLSEYVNFGPPS